MARMVERESAGCAHKRKDLGVNGRVQSGRYVRGRVLKLHTPYLYSSYESDVLSRPLHRNK